MNPYRRNRARKALVLCVLFGVAHVAHAQDAMVRASLENDDEVWVGQQVKVIVELLAPGYFASAAAFDLPDPEGVLLIPPASHPLVSSETIDGVRYTVQRHELAAWPMRAGDDSVPAVTVRFSYKRSPLDTDEVPAAVTTVSLPFTVRLPPGATGLGTVISARDLEVEESWDAEPGSDEIPAGTAFKRTITFSAPDVPGMIFPPFPAGDIDGLGVYAKQRLQDHADRGSLTGMRQDVITYICERPGRYTIPAVRFTWFDLDSTQLKTEDFPAYTLNVVANPAMASAGPVAAADNPVSSGTWPWRLVAAGLALLLVALFAARSARSQGFLARCIAPFRPVHLEPLYPGSPAVRRHRKRRF